MFGRFIDFVFPAQCAACTRPGNGLCARCASPGALVERDLSTLHVRALGEYSGAYRSAVRALKDGRRDVADALCERLRPLVAPGDVLVWVPTTRARKRARGFDGVEYLARTVAAGAGATATGALRCIGNRAQRGRTRAERLVAHGRFICVSDCVTGCRIRLVDDVCTTGTTLEDCAAQLRSAGATVVDAIVVALA